MTTETRISRCLIIGLLLTLTAHVRRLRSRRSRLADVGRHAGSQHGVEHEGAADHAGTSRRRRTSSGSPSLARRRTAIPSSPSGMVFVGTNNEAAKRSEHQGRQGHPDGLPRIGRPVHVAGGARQARGRPRQRLALPGRLLVVRSSQDGVVYYVSNRGELMAVDRRASATRENDGPFKEEKLTREVDADIIWRYDMMEELGVQQHNMANSSPVMFENLIFVSTSNGQDESHVNVPSPKAPSIIARRQDDRKARLGGQSGRRKNPARPVVVAGGGQSRRHGAGRHRPG